MYSLSAMPLAYASEAEVYTFERPSILLTSVSIRGVLHFPGSFGGRSLLGPFGISLLDRVKDTVNVGLGANDNTSDLRDMH